MTQKTKSKTKWIIFALVAAVIAVLGYIFFPGLPEEVRVYDVVQLNRRWTPEERQWFYHTSQGSQLMPYSWFVALAQPNSEKRFIDPDFISRFRLIPDQNPVCNPDRLPVGFAKDPPDPVTGVENVGITCAGCHTAQLNYKGLGVRIDGAPGMADFNTFLKYIGISIGATYAFPSKFDHFAERVLGSGYSDAAKRDLKNQVAKYLGGQLVSQLQTINADEKSGLKPTEAGFGRIDALGQGGNRLFGLLNPKNLRALNAPVDVIPLWYAYSYGWVRSNSAIRQPLARNIIEALAVNASLVMPAQPGHAIYTSSARLNYMHEMEEVATKLEAPRWPEDLFGGLDQEKVARGKVLYKELCAGCHQPELETPTSDHDVPVVPTGSYPPDVVSEAHGRRFYRLRLFEVDKIGTDPNDAVNFADRRADATAIGLGADEPGANVIYPVIAGIMQRYYQDHRIPREEQVRWDGYRTNSWRAPKAYPARPLAGAWATAPYLHNGSVPNLYELLLPAEERSKSFYTGDLEFDPQRVGYRTERFYGGFVLDTSKSGNLNTGHEFSDAKGSKGVLGRLLTDDERWQLVEYLKALRFEDEVPPDQYPPAGWLEKQDITWTPCDSYTGPTGNKPNALPPGNQAAPPAGWPAPPGGSAPPRSGAPGGH